MLLVALVFMEKNQGLYQKGNMSRILFYILIPVVIWSNAMAEETYLTTSEMKLKGHVRTSLDSPKPTHEQLERKEKFSKLVASLNVPVLDSLPVVEDSSQITPRTKESISKRAIAIALAAVKGEGLSHKEVIELVEEWGVISYFTKDELNFINNPNPTNRERVKFAWRYEGLDVLLWALGYKDKLPKPNKICDVKTDISIIKKQNNFRSLVKNSKIRNISEILDMADYYYRLHWAAIELRLKGEKIDSINEEIIMERHYALNWLIRYMNQNWDDISTDT